MQRLFACYRDRVANFYSISSSVVAGLSVSCDLALFYLFDLFCIACLFYTDKNRETRVTYCAFYSS